MHVYLFVLTHNTTTSVDVGQVRRRRTRDTAAVFDSRVQSLFLCSFHPSVMVVMAHISLHGSSGQGTLIHLHKAAHVSTRYTVRYESATRHSMSHPLKSSPTRFRCLGVSIWPRTVGFSPDSSWICRCGDESSTLSRRLAGTPAAKVDRHLQTWVISMLCDTSDWWWEAKVCVMSSARVVCGCCLHGGNLLIFRARWSLSQGRTICGILRSLVPLVNWPSSFSGLSTICWIHG